jgi:hypothetical protein
MNWGTYLVPNLCVCVVRAAEQVLNQASLFGEFDDVRGVTENIILGQVRGPGATLVYAHEST